MQRDIRKIENENVENFELPSNTKNDLQSDSKLAGLSLSERRKLCVDTYKTFLGITKDQGIECNHQDLFFYAETLSKGDPECILTCSKEEMLANREKLPRGGKTINFVAAMEKYMQDKDENSDEDKAAVSNMLEQGCTAVGSDSNCAEKRFFWLPFIPAIIGLVKLAGIAAAGYITNMSKSESTK